MSDVRGVVITHGNLARCLVETAESISGVPGALAPISNDGCSPDVLVSRIKDAVDDSPSLLFVDLASGSCAHAARFVGRQIAGIAVVTGVNLPMLLDFSFHRDLEVSELAERVVEKGRAGATSFLPESPA